MKTSQLRINPSDLQRFNELTAREGMTGKQAEKFTALLDRFEEGRDQESKSVDSVTSTVQWFTTQIDELKAQVEELIRERDHLTSQLAKQSVNQTTSKPTIQLVKPQATAAPPRISSSSTAKVNSIIDALIAWNTAQESRAQQVRISVTVIKALGKLIESTYQPAIQEALKERVEEIDEIHSRFMLGARHNRSIEDKDGIIQAIARDYLGVDNWQEASFG